MRFKKGVLSVLLAMPVLSSPLLAGPGKVETPVPQQRQEQRQEQRQAQQVPQRQEQQVPQRQEQQQQQRTTDQDYQVFDRQVTQIRNRCNELRGAKSGKQGGFKAQLGQFNITVTCGMNYSILDKTDRGIPFPGQTTLISDFSSTKHDSSQATVVFAERGTGTKCSAITSTRVQTNGDMSISFTGEQCEELYTDKLITLCRDKSIERCEKDGDCSQTPESAKTTCGDLERAKRG